MFRPAVWNGVPVPYDAPVSELRDMLRAPGPRAWAAVRALVDQPNQEALAALAEAASCADPFIRRAALEAIGNHRLGQTVPDVVLRSFRDPNEYVVRAACDAAAALNLVDAHDEVARLVSHHLDGTRLAALRALRVLWQPGDFTRVFDRYLHDRSTPVRKEAAWTLHVNPDGDNSRPLFVAWSTDPLPRHRVWACEIARMFADTTALPALTVLSTDRDGHVRRAADRAIARIGTV